MPSIPLNCNGGKNVERYVRGLHRVRIPVIIVWLLLAGALAYFASLFLDSTTQQFNPPPGSQSASARRLIVQHFPSVGNRGSVTVFVRCAPEILRQFNLSSVADVDSVEKFFKDLGGRVGRHSLVSRFESYFSLKHLLLAALAENMISHPTVAGNATPVRSAVLGTAFLRVDTDDSRATNFVPEFERLVAEARPMLLNTTLNTGLRRVSGPDTAAFPTESLEVGVTGIPVMTYSALSHIKTSMGNADAVVMPIAMVIFGVTVGSVRLLVFPLACIALTLGLSFALCYFVTFTMPMYASVPSLMMSLAISMSIDYNLFLLTRFVEEVQAGNRGIAAVVATVRSAGGTILVSALTLIVPFCTLCIFPIDMMRSFGVGSLVAIFMALSVSLTLTPAILLMFGGFFEKAAEPSWLASLPPALRTCCIIVRRCCRRGDGVAEGDDRGSSADSLPSPTNTVAVGTKVTLLRGVAVNAADDAPEQQSAVASADPAQPLLSRRGSATGDAGGVAAPVSEAPPGVVHRIFVRLAAVVRLPWNAVAITVVLAIFGACVWLNSRIVITNQYSDYFPRGSPAEHAFFAIEHDFGSGTVEPYHIVFAAVSSPANNDGAAPVVPASVGFLTEEQWEAASAKLRALIAAPDLPFRPQDVTSPLLFGDTFVSYSTMQACNRSAPMCPGFPDLSLKALLAEQLNKTALLAFLSSPVPPTGLDGERVYHTAVRLLQSAGHGDTVVKAFIDGDAPCSFDAISAVYAHLPLIAASTSAAVLIIVGLAFRSLVVPLRCLLTILLTEAFAFAFTVLVYQFGIAEWLGWGAIASHGAVTWIAPILSGVVIVGIALDYDIFLLTRVDESLRRGTVPRTAVAEALGATGPVITAAGLIMAVAFFGLVLSDMNLVSEVGMLMVIAVLFDTFVVRTFFAPAVMGLLGRWHWWPRKLLQVE